MTDVSSGVSQQFALLLQDLELIVKVFSACPLLLALVGVDVSLKMLDVPADEISLGWVHPIITIQDDATSSHRSSQLHTHCIVSSHRLTRA